MLICYNTSYVYSKNSMEASDSKNKQTNSFPLCLAYKEDIQLSPAMHIYISVAIILTFFAVTTMKQHFYGE